MLFYDRDSEASKYLGSTIERNKKPQLDSLKSTTIEDNYLKWSGLL